MITKSTPQDLENFCDLLGVSHGPDMRGMKLVTDKGIEAMVAFDYWTPNSVQMHVWCGGQLTRKFLYEIFKYLFVTNDKGLVICVIPCDNTASLDLSQRVGFHVVHEIPDGWAPGTSMVIQELRKHECIWLRGQYGTKHPTRSAVRPSVGRRSSPSNGQSGSLSFRAGSGYSE